MTVFTEPNNLKDFLAWEEERDKSRKQIIILAGENVALAEVLGVIAISCPETGTADAGNTGDGLCASVAAGSKTKIGTYTLTCISEAANGGAFAVRDPDGFALPDAAVGVVYENENINFTLSDGAEDFDIGDIFTIAVVAGSGKYVPVDAAAIDGSQNAAGIAIDKYDATEEDIDGVVIDNDAIIVVSNLVWPDGATLDQKTKWLADLAKKNIFEREEA